MIKQAQQRDLSDRAKDVLSPHSTKEWFNQDLKEKMIALRETDDKLRATIYNKKISKQKPELNVAGSLKELIALTKKSANRLEYVDVFTYLDDYHRIMSKVKDIASEASNRFKSDYKEVLVQDVDKTKRDKLIELQERLKNAINTNHIIKRAGIMDWLHTTFSKRGRELKYWAENNKKEAEKLKKDTESLLKYSEQTLSMIENCLKAMSLDLVRRNAAQYAANCRDLVKFAVEYDKIFKIYYNQNMSPILEDLKKAHEAEQEKLKSDEAARLAQEQADLEAKRKAEEAKLNSEFATTVEDSDIVSSTSRTPPPLPKTTEQPKSETKAPAPKKSRSRKPAAKNEKKAELTKSELLESIKKLSYLSIK